MSPRAGQNVLAGRIRPAGPEFAHPWSKGSVEAIRAEERKEGRKEKEKGTLLAHMGSLSLSPLSFTVSAFSLSSFPRSLPPFFKGGKEKKENLRKRDFWILFVCLQILKISTVEAG